MPATKKSQLTAAIGRMIVELRKALGYRTQQEFSEAIGISRTLLGYIEGGSGVEEYRHGVPSDATLLRISKLPGLSVGVRQAMRELAALREHRASEADLLAGVNVVRMAMITTQHNVKRRPSKKAKRKPA